MCGSVYTGGKTAKDIKKQAEQSAITADDAEIIEIPEPVELYETDCLREPEDSEDASPCVLTDFLRAFGSLPERQAFR